MTDHSALLGLYQRIRVVRLRLNHLLTEMISKEILEECGRKLGFFQKGVLVFEAEDEVAILMDYCIYNSAPDGRNFVRRYLEESPPPAGSEEWVALQEMTHAYYSLFQIITVERGVGATVRDVLRDETNFLVDVGIGTSARPLMMLATRMIPEEGFLSTGGAGLPVNASAAKRIAKQMMQSGYNPETFDFKTITPQQEAELAALIIRSCRATGMSSQISYREPGDSAPPRPIEARARRPGRNEPCPCGSGKKFKMCCGRNSRW